MKRSFLDRLLNDWVYPLAIVGLVVWLVIRVFGPVAEPEVVEPEPTEEPVIVCMRG